MHRSYTVKGMVAIHRRFRSAMIERLVPLLANRQGSTALLSSDTDVSDLLRLDSNEADVITTLDSRKWDSLICVAQLWQMSDLAAVDGALNPDGRLFFVEPVCGFGLARRAQQVGQVVIRKRYGLDFETDLPQALRDVGLTPTSVDRFRIQNPLFTFVAGEARRY